MNLFTLRSDVSIKTLSLLALASLALSSLPIGAMTAFAASTGVTVNNASLSTTQDTKVNFVISVLSDDTNYTAGTFVFVTDDGAGGSIFGGTIGGDCDELIADADSHFSINQNKGVCYSNPNVGVYPVTVQLRDGNGGSNIGALVVVNVEVTATTPAVIEANAVCDLGCEYTTLAAAVAGENAGETITLKNQVHIITDNIPVNKQLTIVGEAGSTIQTSGGNIILTITAGGVVLDSLKIQKTDAVNQNIIQISANNVTVENSDFSGTYTDGNGQTTRAFEVVGGLTGLLLNNNTISNLRQPAYINNGTTGSITNNHVANTRGWVIVSDTALTFTGNTWDTNAVDIAIISQDSSANLYTCEMVAQMVLDNNGAVIVNQVQSPDCPAPLTPPTVTIESPTPVENSYVRGVITGRALATDEKGMGSYFLRFWKDAFEIAGGGTLVKGCQEAPGADLLGTSLDKSCEYDTTTNPDGVYVFSAQFLDSDTQWGSALRTFNVDNTAPTITVKPESVGDEDSMTFSNVSFKLFDLQKIDKVVINEVEKDLSNNKWSDVNGVAPGVFGAVEGPNTIVVYDVAGNTTTLEFTLVVPVVAPEMPVHVSPSDNSAQSSNDFYFEWTDVAEAVEYEFQSSQNPAVDGNGVLTTGIWNNKINGSGTQNPLNSSNIHSVGANGTWYWQVRSIDTYGNKSDWTAPWKMTIDMVAPSVPVITSPTAEQTFSTTPILNQWSPATDNVAVTMYQIAYAYDDEHTFGGSTCPDVTIGGKWVGCRDLVGTSRNHSPSLAEQGGVTIWVRAYDEAGNVSAWSEGVHYYYEVETEGGDEELIIDTIKPVVEITNVVVSSDKKLSFDLTANDENSGLDIIAANIYNEANTGAVLVSIGSGSPSRLNVPHSGLPEGTLTFSTSTSDIDVSGLADGTYTIRAFARDHANNEHRFLLVQFVITTESEVTPPPTPAVTSNGGGGGGAVLGGGSGGSQSNSNDDEDGSVLGASTSTEAPESEVLGATTTAGTCGMYILDYMFQGEAASNSTWEVLKLQLFLLSKRFFAVNPGVFDEATANEVREYQGKNAGYILQPWVTAGTISSLPPTGNVYKTTRWHINHELCANSEPFPIVP